MDSDQVGEANKQEERVTQDVDDAREPDQGDVMYEDEVLEVIEDDLSPENG